MMKDHILRYVPPLGILCFALLYLYAAANYPGGSQADPNSMGFDWENNYLCNLTHSVTINGEPNPARPFAITGLVVLCFSLVVFFARFARVQSKSILWKRVISISGALSMLFAALIFTAHHDLMTIVSSLFGVVVVFGIIREVYLSNWKGYKVSGIGCIGLLGLNNFIYYTAIGLEYLPILQKVTFGVVLAWIIGLNRLLNTVSENQAS